MTAHKVTNTTEDRQSDEGSNVTGRLARKVVPAYLQRRVEYEGGNYAQ